MLCQTVCCRESTHLTNLDEFVEKKIQKIFANRLLQRLKPFDKLENKLTSSKIDTLLDDKRTGWEKGSKIKSKFTKLS